MRRSGRAEAARGNGAPRPDAGRLAECGSALVAFLTALLLSLAVTLAVTGPACERKRGSRDSCDRSGGTSSGCVLPPWRR